ncbi:hypothetical protein G7Y79_00047g083270 [Physcia stellaris]|nr:hypothetical protein G7Y79_00047g083270 [Physcia stellaris]
MDVTEEDFLAALVSSQALAHAIANKPQGWHSLFYRAKDQLLACIRQTQSLGLSEPNPDDDDPHVNPSATKRAYLEKANALIAHAAALPNTSPKVQQTTGGSKAQKVLGGEAPRLTHKRSNSWQGQRTSGYYQANSSDDEEVNAQKDLANDLIEGRRMVEENLRRLVDNDTESRPPGPPRRRSRTLESGPKKVTFDVSAARNESIASAASSQMSGNSAMSSSSATSAGSEKSGGSYASDRELPTKAMRMLGLEQRTKSQRDGERLVSEGSRRNAKSKEDPLVAFFNGRKIP